MGVLMAMNASDTKMVVIDYTSFVSNDDTDSHFGSVEGSFLGVGAKFIAF